MCWREKDKKERVKKSQMNLVNIMLFRRNIPYVISADQNYVILYVLFPKILIVSTLLTLWSLVSLVYQFSLLMSRKHKHWSWLLVFRTIRMAASSWKALNSCYKKYITIKIEHCQRKLVIIEILINLHKIVKTTFISVFIFILVE